MNSYREIDTYDTLLPLLEVGSTLQHYAFQRIDFGREAVKCRFKDCLFFGCTMPDVMRNELADDCYVFPAYNLPFNMFPSKLYTVEQLYDGYDCNTPSSYCNCYDTRVYNHYISRGKQAADIAETFARALHDHFISDALHDILSQYDDHRVVAVMGGHALMRTDVMYAKIVLVAKHLAESGCLMVTGGGPGAMEAAHLGVWLAHRSDSVVDEVLNHMKASPSYKDEGWLASAFMVREKFPRVADTISIGIPTWFYGHEPATPFATHIAKYFDNSIREDGLLAIAKGGVIYSPGSAGTMQEIFQDAAQNHYLTCGYASPMVFMGCKYWSEEMPVYPLLQRLKQKGRYNNLLLSLTDSVTDAANAIHSFIKSKESEA